MFSNKSYHGPHQNGQVIHSGHFMISSVADDQEENEEISQSSVSPTGHEQSMMIQSRYDFSNVEKQTKDTYQFGPTSSKHITIDSSLARLFKCMSLAYQGGKVISPKWKNFKGMKLTVKDKIRLNNAIWRTWHIQYIRQIRKGQFIIQFATPFDVDFDSHARPEAVVLEGVYWKRRIETVVAEYKKWRAFFLNKVMPIKSLHSKETSDFDSSRAHEELTLTDFTDNLFSTLSQQPFQFPHPREIAIHATNSDMIQPGLLQLQPSVEDFMDFDAFPDLFSPSRKTTVSFTGGPSQVPSDYFPDSDVTSLVLGPSVAQPGVRPADSTPPVMDFSSGAVGQTTREFFPQISLSDPVFSSVEFSPVSYQQHPKPDHSGLAQSSLPAGDHSMLGHPQQFVDPRRHSSVSPQSQLSIVGVNVPVVTQPICIINHHPNPTINQDNVANYSPFSYDLKLTANDANKLVVNPPQTFQTTETFQTNINYVPSAPLPAQKAAQAPTNLPQGVPASTMPSNQRTHKHRKRGNHFTLPLNTAHQISPLTVRQNLRNKPHPVTPHSGQKSSFPIPEKRRSLPEDKMLAFSFESGDAWSLPRQQTSPKANLFADVDMEHRTPDSTSSLLQETDLTQADTSQGHLSLSNEQKRRFNIRVAFTRLQTLISSSGNHSNSKISKASMLNKTVQYIKGLQSDRGKMAQEILNLKNDLEKLQASISASQSQLPATGALLPRHRSDQVEWMFKDWIRNRTRREWKFFLFSKVIRPWFDSYQRTVSTARMSDFDHSFAVWLRDHCSLRVLRSNIVHSLQVMSTSTCILTEPTRVQQQIEESAKDDDDDQQNFAKPFKRRKK